MRKTSFAWLSLALSSALLAACATAPKQAAVAEIPESKGEDMAGTEAAPTPKADDAPAAAPEAGDMHEKCCVACKEGLAADRSGAKPDTIPCADFTATLTPWCLEHFRGKPTMASECK
jgi:hypothetical protein